MELYTENNHPQRAHILGLPLTNLLNKKPYLEEAVRFWERNKGHATKERQDFNINYFKVELSLLGKEISKHNQTK